MTFSNRNYPRIDSLKKIIYDSLKYLWLLFNQTASLSFFVSEATIKKVKLAGHHLTKESRW